MKILKSINTVAGENTYFLENDQALIIVDPGSDTETILSKIRELAKPVAAILLTHTHYDHIMSVEAVREAFDHPPIYVSEKEASWLTSPVDNLSGLARHDDMADVLVAPAEFTFQYEEPYEIAGFTFRVLETPGHSWGGVSFVFDEDEAVITGDALFRETIGRWDLPTGDHDQLIESIKTQLFTLPSHYAVYPGHGMNTTIAHEKTFNPHF
ncbi:MBL fold metallo-hydrolase [Streptococcus caprae]|uniref:MBL fold metallo-hydrolase n=1 Tax=Streptococcus caprae TaxID=1640501 RepID=A0ABV8CXN1_9STRE